MANGFLPGFFSGVQAFYWSIQLGIFLLKKSVYSGVSGCDNLLRETLNFYQQTTSLILTAVPMTLGSQQKNLTKKSLGSGQTQTQVDIEN